MTKKTTRPTLRKLPGICVQQCYWVFSVEGRGSGVVKTYKREGRGRFTAFKFELIIYIIDSIGFQTI